MEVQKENFKVAAFTRQDETQSQREITLAGKVVFRTEILKSVVKYVNLPKSVNPQIR